MTLLDSMIYVTAEALLNSLWQGAALVALVWILLRVIRPTNATTRYAIWWATVLATIFLPVLANRATSIGAKPMILRNAHIGFPSFSDEVVLQPDGPISSREPILRGITIRTDTPHKATTRKYETFEEKKFDKGWVNLSAQALPARWLITLFGVWFVAANFKLARLIRGVHCLQRLKRRSKPLPPQYQRRFGRWLMTSGIKRHVSFRISPETTMPMAIGWVNAVILIPEELMDKLTETELDQVGLHELAHIRRWDDWTKLFQMFVEAFFFFHPAVVWIGRQFNLEREIACDDWVIAMTGERRNLREMFSEINRNDQCPGAAGASSRRDDEKAVGI